jgi:hypothetical protein
MERVYSTNMSHYELVPMNGQACDARQALHECSRNKQDNCTYTCVAMCIDHVNHGMNSYSEYIYVYTRMAASTHASQRQRAKEQKVMSNFSTALFCNRLPNPKTPKTRTKHAGSQRRTRQHSQASMVSARSKHGIHR